MRFFAGIGRETLIDALAVFTIKNQVVVEK
jgi:hypothetical protein